MLHLLLRPEEIKSGRWLSQSGSDPSEYSAWAGRITYMRSTIVREVEAVVENAAAQQGDKTREALSAIEKRLIKVEASATKAEEAAKEGSGPGGAGPAGGGTETEDAGPAAGTADRLEKVEQRLESLQAGLETLLARSVAAPNAAPSGAPSAT